MDPLAAFNGNMPTTISAKAEYVFSHLGSARESGHFAELRGYLSRQGTILPHFHNSDLWALVGQPTGAKQLSPSLLKRLLQGQDRDGVALVRSHCPGGKPLHELLLTLPAELSVLLSRLNPRIGAAVLRAMRNEALDYLQSQAVYVRSGKGRRDWRSAELLGLAFDHALNREGEPHLHTHVLVSPLAWDPTDAKWRTVNLRQCVKELHTVLRPRLRDAVQKVCAEHSITVIASPGLARDKVGPDGWTVEYEGVAITAGSLIRERASSLMVERVIADILDGPYPHQKDLRLLRASRLILADRIGLISAQRVAKATQRFTAFAERHGLHWSFRTADTATNLQALDKAFAMP